MFPQRLKEAGGGFIERHNVHGREIGQNTLKHAVRPDDTLRFPGPVEISVSTGELLVKADDGNVKDMGIMVCHAFHDPGELRKCLALNDPQMIGIEQEQSGTP